MNRRCHSDPSGSTKRHGHSVSTKSVVLNSGLQGSKKERCAAKPLKTNVTNTVLNGTHVNLLHVQGDLNGQQIRNGPGRPRNDGTPTGSPRKKPNKLQHKHIQAVIDAVASGSSFSQAKERLAEDKSSNTTKTVTEPNATAFRPVLTEVSITNIASRARELVTLKKLSKGLLRLSGGEDRGKSSFIFTILLGLGYDLTIGAKGSTTICGLSLESIIRTKCRNASIELTISLANFPALEQEYGSHLNFCRKFSTSAEIARSLITARSADPDISSAIAPHKIRRAELESIYHRMGFMPSAFRLMLLDGENVDYLIDHGELWYPFVEAAVHSQRNTGSEVVDHLEEMNILIERLRQIERRKQTGIDSLLAQISKMSNLDTLEVKSAKKRDEIELGLSLSDLRSVKKERTELEHRRNNYVQELEGGFKTSCLQRMRLVFNEYLNKLDLTGQVSLSDVQPQQVAFCIWDGNTVSSGHEFDDVKRQWNRLSKGRKVLATIGFYLALWEVSNYLPFYFVDVYSEVEGSFNVPLSSLPVILEVLNRKVDEGRQVFISLPNEL